MVNGDQDNMIRVVKQLLKKILPYKVYIWFVCQEGKRFPVQKAKRKYKIVFQKKLNLDNPQTFTEKVNWLKLFYYPYDSLTILAGDKWGLHLFLKERGLSEVSSPILYVFDSVEEICWESLPEKFVIKKSNASAYNIIVTNKDKADEEKIKHTIKQWMNTPYGYLTGECHYEKMQPKIVFERFIEGIEEWRLFCLNGRVQMIQIMHALREPGKEVKEGRAEVVSIYFDLEGTVIGTLGSRYKEFSIHYPVGGKIQLPDYFDQMSEIATAVAKDFPFVRVDVSYGEGRLFLGELTFTPANGYGIYTPSIQKKLGEKLILPKLK